MAVRQWSTTAANNATGDPSINWAEGQAPNTVNGSARAMMAATREWFDGSIVAAANSVSALKALTMTGFAAGNVFMLRGYASISDGGCGLYRLVTSSPGTADDLLIIQSSTSGYWFVRMFVGDKIPAAAAGLVADGSTDNKTAIERANAAGLTIVLGAGDYVSSPFTLSVAGVGIEGRRNSVLKHKSGGAADNFITISGDGGYLRGVTVNGNRAGLTYVYNKGVVVMAGDHQSAEGVAVINSPSMAFKGISGAQFCSLVRCRAEGCGDMGLFISDAPDFSFDGLEVTDFCLEDAYDTPAITSRSPRARGRMAYVSLAADKTHQTLGVEFHSGGDDGSLTDSYVDATNIDYAYSLAGKRASLSGSGWKGGKLYGVEIAELGVQVDDVHGVDIPSGSIGFAININPAVSADSADRIIISSASIFNSTWVSDAKGIGSQGVTNTADHVVIDGFQCFGVGNPVDLGRATKFKLDNFDITAKAGQGAGYAISGDLQDSEIGAGSITVLSGTGALTAAINLDGDNVAVAGTRMYLGEACNYGFNLAAGMTGVVIERNKVYGAVTGPINDNANSATNLVQDNYAKDSGSWTLGGSTLSHNNQSV